MNTIGIVLIIVGVFAIAIIWEIYRTKCPKCGRFFARKVIKSESTYDSSFIYKTQTEKTVSSCKCKYCGHEWQQKYTSYHDND